MRLLVLVAPFSTWAGPIEPPALPPSPLTAPVAERPDVHPDAARADHLVRFLDYVSFPSTSVPPPGQPYVIGVAGADEVFQALGALLVGRTVHNRPLVRRLITEGDPLSGVHLLYLGRRIEVPGHPLTRSASALPVLLVCEHAEGLAAGAVFNFVFVREHLRFEASLAAADRAGLVISSRVLALADRVVGGR